MDLKRPAVLLLLAAVLGAGIAAGWLLFGDDDDPEARAASAGDLFTQTAQGGSFARRGERFTLTLRDVAPATTVFSDRPERRSDSIATEDFVAAYADAFADDPPNATLSSLERGQGEFTVELLEPRYDPSSRTLVYTAKPIGPQGSPLPERFGSASLFIDSGAQTTAASGYACTRGTESDPVWVCTFNDSGNQVRVSDLVEQLPDMSTDSAFCLQASGGAGGNGATAAGGTTGRGGDGGYARTIARFDANTTIGYLIADGGKHTSGSGSSGTGGSSTIVGTGTIDGSSASTAPATNRQFVNSPLLIAGGGGGGSYSDVGKIGHDGGAGGSAVATASSDATAAGGDGHGHRGGNGGDGTGGSGTKDGADGPGGVAGNSTDGAGSLQGPGWQNLAPSSDPQGDPGAGGSTSPVTPSPLYAGGAGGGGYGGGGSGRSREADPGSGGGGGGSLAKQADVDDSNAPSECTDPPSLRASFRIVIFNG